MCCLAALIRAEYPSNWSLAEIAGVWGEGITQEQIDALRWLESQDPNCFSASATNSVNMPGALAPAWPTQHYLERDRAIRRYIPAASQVCGVRRSRSWGRTPAGPPDS